MENKSFTDDLTTSVDENLSTTHNISAKLTDGSVSDGSMSLSKSELASVIIYWTIGSLGVIGNTLVCLIFRVLKQRRSQVNLYILNQAFADLVTGLLLITFGTTRVYRSSIPNEGPMGVFLCRFWWSRFFLFSGFVVSAHNLTLISIERYVAVVHPLRYVRIFTRRFTKVTILLVWLVAPIMQYIFPIFKHTVKDGLCAFQSTWTGTAGTTAGVSLFLWEYFVPCIVMSYAYTKVVLTLKKKEEALAAASQNHSNQVPNASSRNSSKASYARRRNVTNTLLTVFIVYVVCWTPNQFTFLQFNLGGPIDFDGAWYLFTVIVAFVNSCSNPIVYALMHKQFQAGLKLIVRCRTRRRAVGDWSLTERSGMNTVID